jgi:hypothetical protein
MSSVGLTEVHLDMTGSLQDMTGALQGQKVAGARLETSPRCYEQRLTVAGTSRTGFWGMAPPPIAVTRSRRVHR